MTHSVYSHPDRLSIYQTVTNKIIEQLERGTIPWRKPWSSAGPPMNAVSRRPYSGVNLWLLMGHSYESNLWLTFDQVARLGGSVNRGEKGHLVTFWMLMDKGEKETKESSEEGNQKIPLLRYYKVYNIDQCSGIPVSVRESSYERQIYPVAVCESIVQGMPNRPQIRFDKQKAFYHPGDDYINMPPMKRFDDSEGYYGTLFHELIHSTGHKSRLSRKSLTEMAEFGSPTYSFEELVAELGSCYLCSHAGIDQKELKNSAAYIKGWLMQLQNNHTYIVLASSQAQKAVDYILHKESEVTHIGKAEPDRA